MTFGALAALIGVWGTALVSPGPDVVQIIRVAPRGVRAGLMCALGIVAGLVVWISASLAGVSALIATHPGVLHVLQVLGGAYLVWMGVSAVRAGLNARGGLGEVKPQAVNPARAFRLGLSTNLANPKAVVFFGAVFAQFIRPDMSAGWTVAVALIMLGVALVWFCGFSLLVRAGARFLERYSSAIDATSGAIFTLLGAYMVVSGLWSLA